MYLKKALKITTGIFLLFGMFFSFPGCKKGSIPIPGQQGEKNQFYFTFDEGGRSWKADIAEAQDSIGIEPHQDTTISIALMGFSIKNQDTSFLAIGIGASTPSAFKMNKPVTFNTQNAILDDSATIAFLLYGTKIDTTYYSTVTSAGNSAGTITITQLDTIQHVISGTFQATITAVDGSKVIPITDGKFKIRLASSHSQLFKNTFKDIGL